MVENRHENAFSEVATLCSECALPAITDERNLALTSTLEIGLRAKCLIPLLQLGFRFN